MRKKVYFLDIDGTLALGKTLIPGAASLIEEIHRDGAHCCYLTNNSSKGIDEYLAQFEQWGIPVEREEFMTAGSYAAKLLKAKLKDEKIFVLGTESYLNECRREGLCVTQEAEEDVAAVLTAYDTELNYEKIRKVCRLLERHGFHATEKDEQLHLDKTMDHGSNNVWNDEIDSCRNRFIRPWYATNADLCCPSEFGMVPDCGAICKIISLAVGRNPEFLGKPHPGMIDYVLKQYDIALHEAVIVGDRLYTDIECGKRAGISTCLVLTGEEKEDRGQADYCFSSVEELAQNLRSERKYPAFFLDAGRCYRFPKERKETGRWVRGDFHIHTILSDGEDTPEGITQRAQKAGLDFFFVTDHNALHFSWPQSSISVFPGIELTTPRGHANLYGLSDGSWPVHPDENLELPATAASAHAHGLLFSVNHPFLHFWKWDFMELDLKNIDCLEIDNNPALEKDPVMNAKEANQKAIRLMDTLWADGYRICAIGGSDCHKRVVKTGRKSWKDEKRTDSLKSELQNTGNQKTEADCQWEENPGLPSTYIYLSEIESEQELKQELKHEQERKTGISDTDLIIRALQNCHAYVSRAGSAEGTISAYDGKKQFLGGEYRFGDRLPEQTRSIEILLSFLNFPEDAVFFCIINGERILPDKNICKKGEIQIQARLNLPEKGYVWIRFGVEDKRGKFLFYANPLTRGEKTPRLRTFQDAVDFCLAKLFASC